MERPARQRFSVDLRREQLLEAGLEVFSSTSYDAVSMDDLAAAAGVSKGLLYHYFPSKRDYFVAVVEAASGQLREATAPDETLPPDRRLRSTLGGYLDWVEAHARGYRTLMRAGLGLDPRVTEVVETHRDAVVRQVLAGLPRPATPSVQVLTRGWVGLVEGATLEWLERGEPDRERLLQLLASSLEALMALAAQRD